MNIKKLILSSAIALGALSGYAQQAAEVYTFNPHWYGQLQVGAQETLGEGSFGKLLSPNAQIAVGRQFNPIFGLRLGVNAWQSKGVMDFREKTTDWKFNYVAPALDLTFDLTNAVWGYNPERLVDVNLFAGVGANIRWGNDEALAYNNYLKSELEYNGLQDIWSGTKVSPLGRLGIDVDFRITDNVKIGLELASNFVNDHYNSKHAPNCDWYFNGLVGVKYAFGKTYDKSVIVPVPVEPEIVVQEKVVVVHDTIVVEPKPVVKPVQPEEGLERNVFFLINRYNIRPAEMQKVEEVANYMKSHPTTRVHITGYADKGTGTLAINLRLARQRAQAVVNALQNKYGIPANRITMSSMTESEYQPFEIPEQNRVAICIVE